ncbi:MAG: hypothetical protein IKK60_07775 [Clostridia bacterium]|nr:hypothetical protein [Clostridia bacterium]
MKKSIFKRLSIFLACVLMLTAALTMAFSVQAKASVVKVATAAQLENALKSSAKSICITADFELDRTFYVYGKTTIYADSKHTLKRSISFGGDIFVVGENAKGKSSLLGKGNAELTLGKSDAKNENVLIFDGNKANMKTQVKGSFLFIANSSVVNVYKDISFINAKKEGNSKTFNADYALSYPGRIGGAVSVIASGTMNIYGGNFTGNTVKDEAKVENPTEEQLVSTMGGAIYNFGNLKIYGGNFSDNRAGRGGVIYNYRTLKITAGTFSSNRATTHGGVVCQPASQYARIYLGKDGSKEGNKITFKNNSATENAGAIYTRPQSSLIIYGDTTFDSNKASGGNGGAICSYGVVKLYNTVFKNNSAVTRGGAIYLSNSSEELTTRLSSIDNCTFTSNSAKNGGALSAYASDETLDEGAIVTVNSCKFKANTATENGGAAYAGRKSKVTLKNSSLEENSASEGGAFYIVGESKINIENTDFISNKACTSSDSSGGAITVRSSELNIKKSEFSKNLASKNGGALYISYVGDSKKDAEVKITSTLFEENTANNYGGAVYATKHTDSEKNQLDGDGCKFVKNGAVKGGALYLTSGTSSYFEDCDFEYNTNSTVSGGKADAYNGGAVYLSESTLEINGATFKGNSAEYNGGAFGVYSDSKAILNKITATENSAVHAGGFLYNSGSDVKIYNSKLTKNSSEETGGALSLHSLGTTSVYKTAFEENSAGTHGGGAYVYTEESATLFQDCTFTKNKAVKYGGALYASKASILNLYSLTATDNSAGSGGFLYETTTATTVTLNGVTVKGNTASSGPIIYGNTNKAILNLNKTNYKDSDLTSAPDSAYWKKAVANKLTVNEITDPIPSYTNYKENKADKKTESAKKKAVPVTDVFNLGKSSSDADINEDYAKLKKLDNSSNFMSRNTTTFNNINGKDVNVDTFVYIAGHKGNNVSVGEGLLIYQALLYKKAHPKEEVSIDISSFRFSIEAAVNINRNSRYFGYMRNLVGMEYDKYGFVRISYLLVTAAKMGINVTVIGQMDGYPISSSDPNLKEYFTQKLNDPCDPAYVKNGVIGDYLNFNYCYWTAYDDNAATDMMHTKLCAVSHYLDMNGVSHKNAVWSSSSNIDGIKDSGANGNSKMQTATLVSDHEKIYRASSNYLRLISKYCAQEDVLFFRDLVNERTTEQIQLILAGKESKIPKNEQIVYLGGENDKVFELYFAPFGGDAAVWDEVNNPYCKYMRKMYNSDDYIILTWNNANYLNTFPLGKQMESVYISAFKQNTNPRNKIYLNLESFPDNSFDSLVTGKTVGFKSVNQKDFGAIHSKDIQISYSENGQRHYVSILNSLNIHGGSMSYQSNNLLVIKEDNMDKGSVFHTIADLTTKGITENELTEAGDLGRQFSKSEKFSVGKLSAVPYTLEATVQVPESVTGAAGVIIGNYNGSKNKQLNLEIASGGRVKLFYNNGKNKVSCIFKKDIRSDSAVHIAVTVSDNKATLYVNGSAVETKTLKYAYSTSKTKYVIGGDNRKNNTKYFKGTIYSVSLFNDVRTKSEIKRDSRGVSATAAGLIYTKEFLTADRTYSAVNLNGRTFSKSKAYSLGKLSATPYTIESTISVPKKLSGRGGVIVGNYNGKNGKQLNLELYTEGRIRLFFNNGKKKVSCIFKKDLRTGAPVDIAVTVDKKTATLYVNGKAVETKKLSATYSGIKGSFKIGGDNRKGNPEYFKGTIYSVRLFSDVRTKAEIKKDYVYIEGTEKGLISSRYFASQSSVYPSKKLNGIEFTEATPFTLGKLKASPKTIEAVISLPKKFTSRAGVIVGNYSFDGKQLNLEIAAGGKVKLYYNNGSKYSSVTFSKDVRSSRPVHIAVTLDGKKATLYVDGKKTQTLSIGIKYSGATGSFRIGGDNRPGNTKYFKGKIYSVNLFSSVRSEKQIKRDITAVKKGASSLIWSGNLITAKPVYDSGSLGGAKFEADKYTTLNPLNDTPKTIEALINVSQKTTGKAGVILGNCYGAESKQMNLEVIDDGKIKLLYRNGSKEDYCVFSRDIRSSTPVHIAVTVNGRTATLYVNGEKADNRTLKASYSGITDGFKIGSDNRADGAGYFKGTVYSVSLFSDVRTQKEIKTDSINVNANEPALLYSGRYLSK